MVFSCLLLMLVWHYCGFCYLPFYKWKKFIFVTWWDFFFNICVILEYLIHVYIGKIHVILNFCIMEHLVCINCWAFMLISHQNLSCKTFSLLSSIQRISFERIDTVGTLSNTWTFLSLNKMCNKICAVQQEVANVWPSGSN